MCDPHLLGIGSTFSETAAASQIRRLGVADLRAIEQHLLELSFAGRRARFQTAVSDSAVSAYVHRIEPAPIVLVGAFEAPTARLVALAEAHPSEAPWTVELAVSVHELHRQQGLGGWLVTRALALAFEGGAETAAVRGRAWIDRCSEWPPWDGDCGLAKALRIK